MKQALLMTAKTVVQTTPVIGSAINWARRQLSRGRFRSPDYWERRYAAGGNSGAGSYDRLAAFKAEILNDFVAQNAVRSVIEFGCGDGAQLDLAIYPAYVGVDVAPSAVALCRARFADDPTKKFLHSAEASAQCAELALSLDVIYHLVEDENFSQYMQALFSAGTRFVAIYASNREMASPVPHVRHRRFSDWIDAHAPEWVLIRTVPNRYPFDPKHPYTTSFAEFYFYGRRS